MNRRLCILAAALALFALGACGEDNEVGTGVKVEKGDGANNRLGVTTTTAAPAAAPTETTAAPAPTTTAKPAAAAPTTTAAPKPTTTAAPATTAPAAQAFVIEIYSDTSGKNKFEPPQSAVRLGTVVRWVNKDTVNRSIKSEQGGFESPPIPPGGSYDFATDAKGTFNYEDGTRPYAQGVLQVG